jgi:hypothetical protein
MMSVLGLKLWLCLKTFFYFLNLFLILIYQNNLKTFKNFNLKNIYIYIYIYFFF